MVHELTILGSSGTKGKHGGTSAFYIDEKNVIDAGNLLRPLGAATAKIETVWLTHSHLDHIMDIAYIMDSYFEERSAPLVLRGLPETLDAIRTHFLNDQIWPDFSKIDLVGQEVASLQYEPIDTGVRYALGTEGYIEAYPTDHTVPSCGYIVTEDQSSVLITADTYSLASTLKSIEADEKISAIVVECSFPSAMRSLAEVSKHLTPELLFEGLSPLEKSGIALYINHMKPLCREKIEEEISRKKGAWKVKILKDGEKIHF